MKQLLFILCILITTSCLKAQTKALTENGREVILYNDGTWKYSQDSSGNISNKTDSITMNSHQFIKATGATFLVKSNIFNVGVYINPSKWAFSPHTSNEKNPEYRFSFKSNDGYCMMVTERTSIDLQNMPEIALLNAQKASPDAKIISAEYRIVNKKKILCLQIEGTVSGIRFAYLAYYYSNSNGTIQLICYTSKQFFAGLKNELESLLNGLTEIND